MDVVVVLPWVPATAMPYFRRISSASISARGRDLHLDVVARDGRGVDDDVRAFDMTRLVADENLCSKRLESLNGFVSPLIGPRHSVAEIQQDLGDAGHPGAPDAHEVDLLVALKHWRAARYSRALRSRAA